MKLNVRRTFFVGFAFFLICTFWQAYDTIIPKILTEQFGMSHTGSGIVMALDNILALFMLPLFGAISDKNTSRYGKRTPYIVVGTLAATVVFVGLSFAGNLQLTNLTGVSPVNDTAALERLWDAESQLPLTDADGNAFVLQDTMEREEFIAIRTDSEPVDGVDRYSAYVEPARADYAWRQTVTSPGALVVFLILLMVVLVSMATFRSPAVALMPDVTIKPLRSKANAIINLMGTAGGIVVLVLGILFGTGKAQNALMSYTGFFAVVAGVMALALILFLWQVQEPRFATEMRRESARYGIAENDQAVTGKREPLSKGELRSLLLILASVVFWFFGYNAVTSKYSVYAGTVLKLDYNLTLIIAQAAAVVAYVPVGMVASRVGRKKTILAGIIMLAASFGTASFLRENSSALLMNAMFALAGIGWATINVNSFPMVVELSKNGDTGRYTGFYYTASMAAQTLTPILSGALMDRRGMTVLFPYATVFVCLAFVTMLFVRHGDSRPIRTAPSLEALGGPDD